jgi:hypothetical protein
MIPKVLHQGWIGPKPAPDEVKRYCGNMQRMNRDFDYHWFGNEILDQYGNDPYVKYMLTRGEKWAFVVDRIRVLLLKDHGGIWIDPDSEPVKPLNRLTFWGKPWDFVTAHRSPYRDAVQVKRGVAVVDNTVMASAKDGRMINRLYNLSNSIAPVRKGAEYGWEIMDQSGEDTLWLNPRVFYSTGPHPEAIVLHDSHNLGSWCEHRPMKFA